MNQALLAEITTDNNLMVVGSTRVPNPTRCCLQLSLTSAHLLFGEACYILP